LHVVAASSVTAVALAFMVGSLMRGVAFAALIVGMVVALCGARGGTAPREKIDPVGGLALLAFALFALRSFLWLAFETGDELRVFSRNNYGDFPLHLTYINLLADGAPFWPENPIFAGKALTYPLGTDLFHALLALCGMDVLRGFAWIGLALSAATAAMLWRWGRGFAVAGFLFAGGVLGFEVFWRIHEMQVAGDSAARVLVDYQSDDAHQGLVVAWKSLPLALFVTQRGLLYAIPAGLAILASWRGRLLEPKEPARVLPFWSELLLYAAMPLFHLHTFLFLSVVAAWWFMAYAPSRGHLLRLIGAALIPASALVFCVVGGLGGGGESVIGWKPGWMQNQQDYFAYWFPSIVPPWEWLATILNFLVFWFMNFGVWPLVVAWLLARIVKRSGPDSAILLVFPAVGMFLTCCFVRFAPWEWDNTKLMIWSYIAILPPLWECIVARQAFWVRVMLCVVLFFSGAVSLAGGLVGRFSSLPGDELLGLAIVRRSELDGARFGAIDIPIQDRFIAHPTFNHPLLLSGRIFAMGYEGHVWSHGIDYRERKEIVRSILMGEEGWREQAALLGARWLFWGREEEEAYAGSARPWETECALHSRGKWGAIYDLTKPADRKGQ
jgi:hypothetical protein